MGNGEYASEDGKNPISGTCILSCKERTEHAEPHQPFTPEEIAAIFEPESYKAAMGEADLYWCPLIDERGLVRDDRGIEAAIVRRNGSLATLRFAPGDRIAFTMNDAGLGVANGSAGTVAAIEPGLNPRLFVVLDEPGTRGALRLDPRQLRALRPRVLPHEPQAQGRTVDSARVFVNLSMLDRGRIYVAASRNLRKSASLRSASTTRESNLNAPIAGYIQPGVSFGELLDSALLDTAEESSDNHPQRRNQGNDVQGCEPGGLALFARSRQGRARRNAEPRAGRPRRRAADRRGARCALTSRCT